MSNFSSSSISIQRHLFPALEEQIGYCHSGTGLYAIEDKILTLITTWIRSG